MTTFRQRQDAVKELISSDKIADARTIMKKIPGKSESPDVLPCCHFLVVFII